MTGPGRSEMASFAEDYRDFEKVKDDPLAFQDPPGTWEELGPESVPGSDAG